MSEVVKKYVECFRARLDSAQVFSELARRCPPNHHLLTLAKGIFENDDLDGDAWKESFRSFLKGDGSVSEIVTNAYARPLSGFDAVDDPLSGEFKAAGRTMLESDFALWRAHKLLLDAAIENVGVLKELDNNRDMRQFISTRAGFNLHEQLAFADIWGDIFPQS